jgi:adenylate cyclase
MVEIERKFLINKNLWKPVETGVEIRQGYLSVHPERVVRVRIAGDKAYITIKGKATGLVRPEFEYEIPKNEAEILLKMCLDFPIEKIRFKEKINGVIWEIDVFSGANSGLIIAEVELTSEDQKVVLPDWIAEEVSNDYRYFNSWLSENPYTKW